jgi:hypothetical protein
MAEAAMPVLIIDDDDVPPQHNYASDDDNHHDDDQDSQDDNNDDFQAFGGGGWDNDEPLSGCEESKYIQALNGRVVTFLNSIMVSNEFEEGYEAGKEYSRFCRGKGTRCSDDYGDFFTASGHTLPKYAVPLVMKFTQRLVHPPKNKKGDDDEQTSDVQVAPTSVSWKGPEATLVFVSSAGRALHKYALKKSLNKMTKNNILANDEPETEFKGFEIHVKAEADEARVCQMSFSYNPLPVPKKKSFGPVVDMLMAAEELKDLVVRCRDGDVKTFQLLLKLHSGFYKTLNDNRRGWSRSEDNMDEDGNKIMRRTRAYDTAAAWKLITEWFCSHEVEDVLANNVTAMAHAAIIADVDLFVGLKPLLMSRLKAIVITIDNVISIVEKLVPLTLDYDNGMMAEDLNDCLFELLGKGIEFIHAKLLGKPVLMQKYGSLLQGNRKFAEFVDTIKDSRKRGKSSSSSSDNDNDASSSKKKRQRRAAGGSR